MNMLRKLLLSAAAVIASAGFVHAGGPPPENIDLRMRTNDELLKAAAKIVFEEKSKEAAAILKLAEESYKEALKHVKSEEYEFAKEDLNDSTRKAVHAIILSKNARDSSIRDIVMKEEVALLAEREHERKEDQLKKAMAEVDIFIKTAERLLKDRGNEPAAAKLNETKKIYASSKEKIEIGDYDSALEGVTRAYKLATATVKEIKRSQGDILTFPKPVATDPKEMLAYERKKNDAYAFFAAAMVKVGQDGPAKLLSDGMDARAKALKAVQNGFEAEAIEGLKASTELLIKALKTSGN